MRWVGGCLNGPGGWLGMHMLWHGGVLLRVLRRHRSLRIVLLAWVVHGMHLLLLIVPVGGILLWILGHHGRHVLGIVRLIARMGPHVRRHLRV
jgi:hypothetical protein